MIVIAKKGTRKIVKGARYEVQRLYNSQGLMGKTGRIYIKGVGGYIVTNFTDTNGNPLPFIDWNGMASQAEKALTFEDLKIGDILVCKSDRYTTLMQNSKYRIADLKIVTKERVGYQGRKYTTTDKRIKFEGCNRHFDFSSWKFRKLGINESRELQLSSVLGDETQSYSVDTTARKIDNFDNKNAELIKALAKSIIDGYRHELDVIDWACQKSAVRLKLTKDDYKHLLKMPLKDILKIVETK